MHIDLPEQFKQRMKEMLGADDKPFLDCYETPRRNALRINTLKISSEEFAKQAPFVVEPVSWVKNGFFTRYEDAPSRHPYYYAGLYYIQEASAQTPADRLPVEAGDRVLDMCAAPGGKSTQLAGKLAGTGFLVSNDYSLPRARALLRNLEMTGADNFLVLNEEPARIAEKFPGFFDKVLVDAPCSGEGMFRKNPAAAADWSPEKVEKLAVLQGQILDSAYRCLKPGGLLLYSTCTFSAEENEGSIAAFLSRHPQMRLKEIEPGYAGFSEGQPDWGGGNPELSKTVRIWPHRMEGEGHFLALMEKQPEPGVEAGAVPAEAPAGKKKRKDREKARKNPFAPDREQQAYFAEVCRQIGMPESLDGCEVRGGKLYRVKEEGKRAEGLNFLRNGLLLGEFKKGRFEPSQQLALHLRAADCTGSVLRLSPKEERLAGYLRGEDISLTEEEAESLAGWTLVCVDDYPLGFGKCSGRTLKNKLPASWRR